MAESHGFASGRPRTIWLGSRSRLSASTRSERAACPTSRSVCSSCAGTGAPGRERELHLAQRRVELVERRGEPLHGRRGRRRPRRGSPSRAPGRRRGWRRAPGPCSRACAEAPARPRRCARRPGPLPWPRRGGRRASPSRSSAWSLPRSPDGVRLQRQEAGLDVDRDDRVGEREGRRLRRRRVGDDVEVHVAAPGEEALEREARPQPVLHERPHHLPGCRGRSSPPSPGCATG